MNEIASYTSLQIDTVMFPRCESVLVQLPQLSVNPAKFSVRREASIAFVLYPETRHVYCHDAHGNNYTHAHARGERASVDVLVTQRRLCTINIPDLDTRMRLYLTLR